MGTFSADEQPEREPESMGERMTRRDEEFRGWPVPKALPQAGAFIQWKGTQVCMDFTCGCGQHYHIDADFAYAIECVKCKALWEMPTELVPRRVAKFDGNPVKTEIDEDGEGWAKK